MRTASTASARCERGVCPGRQSHLDERTVSGRCPGQRQEEGRPAMLATFSPDPAAMQLGNPFDDCQPQPVAGKVSRGVQPLKGSEQIAAVGGIKSGTVV